MKNRQVNIETKLHILLCQRVPENVRWFDEIKKNANYLFQIL